MSHVYVLTNQHQQFLSKSNEWIDGREAIRLFRSEYKDVAINQMFEANTRDVSLRIELLQCEVNGKGQPQVPEDALGEPAVKAEAAGEPEIEPGAPEEMPPSTNPEVNPEPAPEVTPDEPPEVAPDEPPEIEPQQPEEGAAKSNSAA
ncbi:hypothetical protein [Microbulbifer hainanensis]|uniref:hypothetical protein n=1 Tax=Microbulbifer hainanensis TaxID=2735675 RepID=UPI001865AB9C|nr:hypothetical protein [Microbulbifer hainanensis]